MESASPNLWIFAGPNGAGKSTLVAKYLRGRLPVINPDAIALEMSRSNSGAYSDLAVGRIAVRQRTELIEKRRSFAVETTLSGNSEILLMREASEAGYKVNLVFVGVDSAETSVSRVAHRVQMGLHSVPPQDILRRYRRSMGNLPTAMRIAHRSIIVDNTGRAMRLAMIREQDRKRVVARELPIWILRAIPAELR